MATDYSYNILELQHEILQLSTELRLLADHVGVRIEGDIRKAGITIRPKCKECGK